MSFALRGPLRAVRRLSALAAIALPTAACGPKLLNAVIPNGGYDLAQDIAYGDLPRRQLDLYLPKDRDGGAPVVVFFYGGGWDSGSKDSYTFVGQALASRGFVTAIPDYRLFPAVHFPAFVEDGAAAVAWVLQHIGAHGGDPGRVVLAGHSAGAHIAALLALDPRYLAVAGSDRARLNGLIGIAGPYDFLPLESARLKEVFAVPDRRVTQPITYAGPGAPPALLLHGEDDKTVWPLNSERLAAALESSGVEATYQPYDNLGHIGIVLALAAPFRWLAPVLDDATAFARQVTGGATALEAAARPALAAAAPGSAD